MITGHHGHTRVLHQGLGSVLQPHRPNGIGRRPCKDQTSRLNRGHKVGIFRQEPIAGMDGLGAAGNSRRHHGILVQIITATTEWQGDIGHLNMLRLRIRRAVNSHGLYAHLARRCHDTAGNFTTIGNEDS